MSTTLNTPTFEVGLTPEEKKLYSSLFKALDPNSSGIITGDKARSTFEKSGLPVAVLSQIWQLADEGNLGFLTQFGFCSAMRLIGYSQAGNRPAPGLAQRPGPLPKFATLDLAPPVNPTLQPQSTNSSSFMQSQPSAAIPTDANAVANSPISLILPQDLDKFRLLFVKTVGLPTGELDGNQARSIFLKTKLPHLTLGLIWGLVDIHNSGKLSLASFVVAMHLIQGLLSGAIKQLPPFLPESVWKSVPTTIGNPASSRQSSAGSQHTILRHSSTQSSIRAPSNLGAPPYEATVSPDLEWRVSPTTKREYEAIFNSVDTSGSGKLSADQVAQFLMNSNLTQEALAGIWDLLDIQNTGVFSVLEFSIALFLVNRVRTGGDLPNIVPQSLLESLSNEASVTKDRAPSDAPAPVQSPQKQVSAMDDLAGLFSGPAPAAPSHPDGVPGLNPSLVKSSTTGSMTNELLPKVRTAITGSFRPSSNFGQTLVGKLALDLEREGLHQEQLASPQPLNPVPAARVSSPLASPADLATRPVNYDALRSVPPIPTLAPDHSSRLGSLGTETTTPVPQRVMDSPTPIRPTTNDDLLADSNPEVSGRLSQALSDIANYSNQIRSLSTQTSQLHEKKLRAETEYKKVMSIKTDIEAKLKLLREAYDRELEQSRQIEATLQNLVELNEALRSEASIAEAKLNALQAQLREKENALQALEQQNAELKQKLAALNAEIVLLEETAASKSVLVDQASKSLAVKRSQVQVVIVKVEDLKRNIADLESAFSQHQAAHTEATLEFELLQKQKAQLEQEAYESAQRVAQIKAQQDEKERQTREYTQHVDALKKLNSAARSQSSAASSSSLGSENIDPNLAPATGAGLIGASVGGAIGFESVKSDMPAQQSTPKVASEDDSGSDSLPQSIVDISDKAKELSHNAHSNDVDNEELADVDVDFADLTLAAESQPDLGLELDLENENDTDAKASSSIVTGEKESDGETAMTSPNFSDSNYHLLNEMPGAFLAPMRTDSLTSSVQNNPSMSVRDDNVGETSDRDTLVHEEVARPPPPPAGADAGQPIHSYSTESFEFVEHGAMRVPSPSTTQESTAPPVHAAVNSVDEEFPPITEVELDEESSSDDDDDDSPQPGNYDDARENMASSSSSGRLEEKPTQIEDQDAFDSMFEGMQPAEAENPDSFGGVDFDDLQLATDVSQAVEAFDEFDSIPVVALNGPFSEAPHMDQSSAPNFNALTEDDAANDEWDQLFAGFGNGTPSSTTPQPVAAPEVQQRITSTGLTNDAKSAREIAISDLTDMGFTRESAIEALEREKWNLEAATNRLLDNL